MHRKGPVTPDVVEAQAGSSAKNSKEALVQKRKVVRKTRKVQFADPLAERRVYDKAASPKAETKLEKLKGNATSTLSDLEPPYSLVAHLDLAAKKMNARQNVKNVEDNLAVKTTKSTKSLKSTKSFKSFASIKGTEFKKD